jgi:hypothetical protein
LLSGRALLQFCDANAGLPEALGDQLSVQSSVVTLAGVRFDVLLRGSSNRRYLVIHGDERTARDVLRTHIRLHAGIAYLVAGHQRFVRFDGATLDPNRMFSREGARKNLRLLNSELPAERLQALVERLDREREALTEALLPPPGGLLIALHNSRKHSLADEIPISDRVSLKQPLQPHQYLLCTAVSDFEELSSSPYSVVLQNRVPQGDDGSLSRLAARLGVRYVNIEADLGMFEKQSEMLDWVDKNLP